MSNRTKPAKDYGVNVEFTDRMWERSDRDHASAQPAPSHSDTAASTDPLKSVNDALKKQLECPVCFNTCFPPIYMCVNGHNVCNKCCEQITSCSVCREQGRPKIRNLFAEKMSSNVKLPCKNTDEDCQGVFSMHELGIHLPKCPEQFIYKCAVLSGVGPSPVLTCLFKGARSLLIAHVRECHKDILSGSPVGLSTDPTGVLLEDQKLLPYLFGGCQYLSSIYFGPRLVSAHSQHFWCYFGVHDQTALTVYAVYIGGKKGAARFKFNVQFASKDGNVVLDHTGPVLHLSEDRKYMKYYINKNIYEAFVDDGKVNCTMKILAED